MFAPLVKAEEERLVRALVADDNATYRKVVERRLRSFGMAVTAVGDGKAALEELAKAQRAHAPYALLVIDSEMPGMDGFAFAALAQQRFGLGRAIVMMLTSDKCGYTATRCLELGIVAHLLKPLGRIELLSAAQQVVGEALPVPWQKPLPQAAVVHDKAPSRPWRVLLAEDNLINRKVALAMLQRAGHGVMTAETGKEAVELATNMDFDFILMDIQMPEMDGLEATRMIRDKESGSERHVPIIAMTAHAFKGDHERFLAAGMDGYIAKPFQPSELLETLQKIHSQLITTRLQVAGTVAQSAD